MASNQLSARLTETYGRQLKAVSDRVMREVERRWVLRRGDLGAPYDRWVEATVAAILAGQALNIRITAGYMRAYERAETGKVGRQPDIKPEEIVGKTYGGGDVRDWAESPRIKAKTAIAEGVSIPEAIAQARDRAIQDAGLHTYAAQREASARFIQLGTPIGYRRKTHGETCGGCIAAMTNEVLSPTANFKTHPNCDCTAVPVYDRNRGTVFPNGRDIYRTLSPSQRVEAFGPETANAINEGVLDVFDLEGESVLDFAPNFLTQRPLQDAL